MTWQDRCRALGGVATQFPSGGRGTRPEGGQDGAPACRLPDGAGWVYVPADLTVMERLARVAEDARVARDKALGGLVGARDSVLEATGLDQGLAGVLAKVTGLPRWVLVVGGLGVLVVVVLPYVAPYLKQRGT